MTTSLEDALHEHFGFPAFRRGQEEAVRAAAENRDVLVVMPTGAGKSLCYQLPALLRDDLSIVVSPLVSLMADQFTALRAVRRGASSSSTPSRTRRPTRTSSHAPARASFGCCTSRPSGSARPASSRRCAKRRSGCSWSTRRTASRSGGTTSALTTSASPMPPLAGRRRDRCVDRNGDAAGRGRHRRAPELRRPGPRLDWL